MIGQLKPARPCLGGNLIQSVISITSITAWNFAAIVTMMFIGWLISLRYRNVTIVDSLWGLGFVMVVWITYFSAAGGFPGRKALIAVLATAWGVRLSYYLSKRNWKAGEDRRYAEWRRIAGERFWLASLFKVFLLQAIFLWVISLVLQFGQFSALPNHFVWLDSLGVCLWTAGFFFEVVADRQLANFKKDPANRGRVMDRGLWAYSRHPNYFGEFLIWWGFFLITLSTPGNWWTVTSPLIVSAVLLKMTGIPLTESVILKTRPAYREYVERTSAFVPWFRRKETS
jgi:steroid 5-alpha reductase family enzyme